MEEVREGAGRVEESLPLAKFVALRLNLSILRNCQIHRWGTVGIPLILPVLTGGEVAGSLRPFSTARKAARRIARRPIFYLL